MADARRLTAPIAVACVAFTSLVVRAVASGSHAAPRYFPDEYLYTALARSLGDHGRPLVRGTPGDFPALLEPLLAAPLQALFSPEAAYRLAQIENALFMSVAAVPAYLLARRLSLAPWYAAGCAVFAVAIPDLLYSAYILADAVAYPLVLSAILAGVATVDRPSPRSQLAFLALALVTAFARVQYVVLPAAFVVAALAVDRRRAVRAQRLPLILLALALLAILGVGVGRLFGFYSGVTDLWDGTRVAKWIATDLFLVAMSVGVVLVPGAVIALVKARGRTETAFAAFAGTLVLALLTQAALFPRFQERYLFPVLPLIPIAFGLYLKNGRAAPRAAVLIAVVLFAASARLPLSGYTAASGKTDSPFLFAVARLEDAIGVANASLLVAAAAAVGAAAAVAVARWGGGRVALAMTIAFVATASAGAAAKDRSFSRLARRDLAPDRSWVDATRLGDVTLVQTVGSPASPALQQLFFNRSITSEVRLGDAERTDRYSAPRVRVAADGTLQGVRGPLLVHGFGTTARFANARRVARFGAFELLTYARRPRLAVLAEGRYVDGWLSTGGRFEIWTPTRGTVRFALSLPTGARPITLTVARARYRVQPGRTRRVAITLRRRGPWNARFSSSGGSFLGGRVVSVRSTLPTFTPASRRP